MRIMGLVVVMLLTSAISPAQDAQELTKEHQMLAKNAGERSGTMVMWMQGPDKPQEIPFSEVNTVVHNGFWVESKFESGPYKGIGMSGYDPIKKKFVGTWTNNMTPHMAIMEGTFDESKNELTMHFKDFDPMAGKILDHKAVTLYANDIAEEFTMYKKDEKSGKWVKSFALKYVAKEE